MSRVELTLRASCLLVLLVGCRAETVSPDAAVAPAAVTAPVWHAAPERSAAPVTELPDILVIVLDTTGTAAVERVMPNTRAFLESNRTWSQAIAPSNSTMETVAGIMTGTWMSNARLWDPGFVTLSEALKSVGYQTFIGSANPVLDHPFYIRGFDRHHVKMHSIRQDAPDLGLVEVFEEVWAELKPPRMAWLQMAACHDYRIAQKNYIDDGPPRGESELREAWEAYTLDCADTDSLLPRILATNPAGITVITSDHGELFGHMGSYMLPSQAEHGHGVSNSPMEIQVPLSIRGPGFPQGRVDGATSLLDLRTTLLAVAGLQVPGGDLRTGRELRPAIASACDVYDQATSGFAVRVRDDGSQVLRIQTLPDVPELVRWQPGSTAGLDRSWTKLKARDLDAADQELLHGAAWLTCIDDRDICAQHPELSSLGYIDCP